jgi:hypothetical protein
MPEQKWFYYVHNEGNAIMRVSGAALQLAMPEMGFQACSYREYLKARKEISAREEHAIDIKEWLYYVRKEDNAIARLNSDAFEWRMGELGFEPVSYRAYLKARRLLRDKDVAENKLNMAVKIRTEDKGDQP